MVKAELTHWSSTEFLRAQSRRRKERDPTTRNRLCPKSWAPIIMYSMQAIKRASKTLIRTNTVLNLRKIFLLEPTLDMEQSKIILQVIFKRITMLSHVML